MRRPYTPGDYWALHPIYGWEHIVWDGIWCAVDPIGDRAPNCFVTPDLYLRFEKYDPTAQPLR